MVESNYQWNQDIIKITTFIGKRLSSPKLREYIDLMKLFRSGGIEADQLLKSLLVLFEEDELLSKTFNNLMGEEIRELKKKETEEEAKRERKRKSKNDDEVEEGEFLEDHCRVRVRYGGEERSNHRHVRVRYGGEADLPIKKRSKYRLQPTGPVL